MRVKVSVVMPVYNAAPSIGDAIRSVLRQKNIRFELLIGDDGSTDSTWKVIREFSADPRVRVFRFRRNRGVAATSNRLIARARGKYISSCDADDRLLPGNLSRLARVLDSRPSYGVAYADSFVISVSGKKIKSRRFEPETSWELLGGRFANGGTLIRKSLVRKIGGYRTQFAFLEDCDLFVRLSEITKFYYLRGKPLYRQQKTKGSLSDQSQKKLRQVSQSILRDALKRRYDYKIRW